MGNPAGVRRDFESLEQRRREAAELLRQGMHPAEVARRVGVHRQSVGRWAQQLKQGGLRALKKADRAGRRPRLSPEELRRIERGLKRGPQLLGYETACGPQRGWLTGSNRNAGFNIIPAMCGASCGDWDGVVSDLPGAPWSEMRRRSGSGSRSAGRRLKKSPQRRPHDHLHR